MSDDEKAQQVGSLMIELKSAKQDAAHWCERVKRLQSELVRAGTGTLRYCLTTDNVPFLSTGNHLESKVELPTTDELLEAVNRCEEHARNVGDLKARLHSLGFPS